MRACVVLALLLVASHAQAATVTALSASPRGGQVFVTFTKNAGNTGATTYDVYRSTSPIASLAGAVKVATLDADSWHSKYDDTFNDPPHLSQGFIITDDGPQLSSSQGLFVWTSSANGPSYWAVVNSQDATIAAAVNTIGPITETTQDPVGWVRVHKAIKPNATSYRYIRWEPSTNWRTVDWGPNWFQVWVYVPATGLIPGMVAPYPVDVTLHGAIYAAYMESGDSISINPHAVIVATWDLGLDWSTADPYRPFPHSMQGVGVGGWAGRYDAVLNEYVPFTEKRVTDYTKLVLNTPELQADSTRVYMEGASMGSKGAQICAHYPDLYAACVSSLPIVDLQASGAGSPWAPPGTIVHGHPGLAYEDYEAISYSAAHTPTGLPATIYTLNKDDQIVYPPRMSPAIDALEANHQPYAVRWGGPGPTYGHSGFYIDSDNVDQHTTLDLFRFARNEAVPAFSNASSSDAFGVSPLTSTQPGFFGQRNKDIDWDSRLHSRGGQPITDTATDFGITLYAPSSGAITVDVTPRRTQQFHPTSGQQVTWTAGAANGVVVADTNGIVTVPQVPVAVNGTRLALSLSGNQPPPVSLTCSPNVSLQSSGPATLTYAAPLVSGVTAPFNVTCQPPSGSIFPIGSTPVSCSVTDSRQRTASCGFSVTLTLPPPIWTPTNLYPFVNSSTGALRLCLTNDANGTCKELP